MIPDLIQKNDSAFFLYEEDQILKNIRLLTELLSEIRSPEIQIYFSTKTNPNAEIIKTLQPHISGFDVSSFEELKLLKRLGIPAKQVTASGPGKNDPALDLASSWGIECVHIDSKQEFDALKNASCGKSLRIPTSDPFAKKLGVPTQEIETILSSCPKEAFVGLHAYLGRESFTFTGLSEVIEGMHTWIEKHPQAFVANPKLYIGPGVPALDKEMLAELRHNPTPVKSDHPITFEVGRSLVSTAGSYACPVLSVKQTNRDRCLAIVEGGVQHLGSPLAAVFKNPEAIEYAVFRDGKEVPLDSLKPITLYGSLCLWHDSLYPNLGLPEDLRRDDWLVFGRCGAYGWTAAVPLFIGASFIREYVKKASGAIEEITPQEFTPYHYSFSFRRPADDT